jgi:threonine dehydrogenase-like Zn-dependent dehydrogenase
MAGIVLLTVKDDRGALVTHDCHVVDISEKGVGIESPQPVVPDADAYLEFTGQTLASFACVRHCHEQGPVHRVGLVFRAKPRDWPATTGLCSHL